MELKICPKCKNKFKCEKENCWCKKIKLPKNKLNILREKYNDCLCPNCLN